MTIDQFIELLEARGWKGSRPVGSERVMLTRFAEGRACEANAAKPGIQVRVQVYTDGPYGKDPFSMSVRVTGQVDGRWYELQAYGLSPSVTEVDRAQERLLKAWEGLT